MVPTTDRPFAEMFARLRAALNASTISEVAEALGVSAPAIYTARKNDSFPFTWVATAAVEHKINPYWLVHGVGPRSLASLCENKPTVELPLRSIVVNEMLTGVYNTDAAKELVQYIEVLEALVHEHVTAHNKLYATEESFVSDCLTK